MHHSTGCDVLLFCSTPSDTGVRVAMELAKAGCEVAVHCPQIHLSRYAPGVRAIHPPRGMAMDAGFLRSLEREQPSMVIPCDDPATRALHTIAKTRPAWAARIERWLGDETYFEVIDSRAGLLRALEDLPGVLIPEWDQIRSEQELRAWGRRMGADRFVLKRAGTAGGLGVRVVQSGPESELAFSDLVRRLSMAVRAARTITDYWFNLYTHLRPQGWQEIIAQRYIPGRVANAAVYCDRGRVLAQVTMEVLERATEVSPSATLRRMQHAGIDHAVQAAAERLGLSGFHGFDFIVHEGTGEAWLLELNPRVTPTAHLPLGEGGDLIAACLETMHPGSRILPRTSVEQEVVALFPRQIRMNAKSPYLRSAYHDVDWSSPEFVERSLRRMLKLDLFGWAGRMLRILRQVRPWLAGAGWKGRGAKLWRKVQRVRP